LCGHLHRAGSSHWLQCCTKRALIPDIFGFEHFQFCAEVIVVGQKQVLKSQDSVPSEISSAGKFRPNAVLCQEIKAEIDSLL
jgi:hypothetical protein